MEQYNINIRSRIIILCMLCSLCFQSKAEKILVDGIYYIFSGTTATVSFSAEGDIAPFPWKGDYEGDIIIPPTVTYDNTVYTVTTIGSDAFSDCKQLSSIQLPPTITTIGGGAFSYCSKLKEIKLPESLQIIKSYAFLNCTGLTSVIIPDSVTEVKGFDGCTGLTSVKISSNAISVSGFEDCSALTELVIPESVKKVGNFNGCSNLRSIVLPKRLESIGTFQNCISLSEITIPEGISEIGEKMFIGCSGLRKVNLSEGITHIGYNAFKSCSGLQTLSLPESLKSIGEYAFSESGLREFIAPSGLKTIMYHAFDHCTGLLNVRLNGNLSEIGSSAFTRCTSLREITIPASVTQIKDGVFSGCSNLSIINIPESVTEFGSSAFSGTAITAMHIPAQMSYIPSGLFSGCKKLSAINLPDNITAIKASAFASCESLKNIIIPQGVTTLGASVFRNVRFESIIIPADVSQIGKSAFADNPELKDITFLGDVCDFGENTFQNCSSLRRIVLPKSINMISGSMFGGCTSLQNIEIPESVTLIGDWSFNGTGIEYLTIPNTVTTIETYAFHGSKLKELILGKSVNNIGFNAFANTNLKKVVSLNRFPPITDSSNTFRSATFFVPAASLEYYTNDAVWSQFTPILPIETISDVSVYNLSGLLGESGIVQVIVEPEGFTYNSIKYEVEDSEIVTINRDGTYTLGPSFGQTTATAIVTTGEDNHALSKSFKVTVRSIPVQAIDITGERNTIRQGHSIHLNATVSPSDATNSAVVWSSSDTSIAIVDESGVVTGVSEGDVTVFAYSTDGSEVCGRYKLTVLPVLLGDSNDDDRVTITDAVNTANYAVGITPEVFVFRAADVNGDNRISLADASGTVAIVLDQPVLSAMRRVHAMTDTGCADNDVLAIEDFNISAGEAATIAVRLDGTRDYVAMQGDIIVPDGLRIVDISTGARSAACHTVATKRLENGIVRFAIFDINNNAFEDNDEAILSIAVMAEKAVTSDLAILNILGSDADAKEHMLTSAGGHNNAASGISDVDGGSIRIEGAEDGIRIYNAEGSTVMIVAPDGTTISRFTANSAAEHCNLVPGIYVVTAGEIVKKVIVK